MVTEECLGTPRKRIKGCQTQQLVDFLCNSLKETLMSCLPWATSYNLVKSSHESTTVSSIASLLWCHTTSGYIWMKPVLKTFCPCLPLRIQLWILNWVFTRFWIPLTLSSADAHLTSFRATVCKSNDLAWHLPDSQNTNNTLKLHTLGQDFSF